MTYQEEMTTLLRDAVSAVVRLAADRGVGPDLPTQEYTVEWMEEVDATHATRKEDTREKPSFSALGRELGSDPWALPEVEALVKSATDFAQSNAPLLGFLTNSRLMARAVLPLYFENVGTLSVDEDELTRLCTDYVAELTTPTVKIVTTCQIQSFSAEQAFDLAPGVKFRPVSDDDVDRFGRMVLPGFSAAFPDIDTRCWLCEVEKSIQKGENVSVDRETVEQIASALNLTVRGRAIFTVLATRPKSSFSQHWMSGGSPVATSRMGSPIALDESLLERFKSIYDEIVQVEANGQLFKFLQLPFRRMRSASDRIEQEDQLVDYVIGLERLLAHDSPHLETTHRFRLRGAALLPDSFGNGRERIDRMSKLYGLRSKVVHGDASPDQLEDMVPKAEDALREILLWHIRHGATFGDPKQIVRRLDEAMVDGGRNWSSMAKKEPIIRVYKFLSEEWAIEDIKMRRIKISEIRDLNDPFDLIPFDLSDPEHRRAFLSTRDQMNDRGILSFSRSWSSPLLWAHYADKHRGICLGFDVARSNETYLKNIEYVKKRLPLPDKLDGDFAEQFLFAKLADWEYEKEVRGYASRDVEENGKYYAKFDDNHLTLCTVILGHRCSVELDSILELLSSYSEPVSVIKARPAHDSFLMVEDENGFAD